MFERFTQRARRVLVLAQEEARLLGHNFIGTEHLLLGLVREDEGVAALALEQLGVRLDEARERVVETVGPSGLEPSGSLPFTPRAKRSLELALREALQLGHNYIGTVHLLLGILREGEGVGAQILVALGADLSSLRQQVIQLLSGYAEPQSASSLPPESEELRTRAEAPRCGRCAASLSRTVRYRTVEVPPGEGEPGEKPLSTVVFYCSHCGSALGPPVELREDIEFPPHTF